FKTQLQQIKKMGNLKDLMGMIPGVGKQIKDIDVNDDSFKGIEAMINSMTLQERRNPDIINPNRKIRIAKGAGKDLAELNAFLKQFEQMKGMMKMMNKMPMGKMQGMMGKRKYLNYSSHLSFRNLVMFQFDFSNTSLCIDLHLLAGRQV